MVIHEILQNSWNSKISMGPQETRNPWYSMFSMEAYGFHRIPRNLGTPWISVLYGFHGTF